MIGFLFGLFIGITGVDLAHRWLWRRVHALLHEIATDLEDGSINPSDVIRILRKLASAPADHPQSE